MRLGLASVLMTFTSLAWAQDDSLSPRLLQASKLKAPVDQALLQRQFDTLRAMNLDAVEYSPRGPITSVVGQTGIVLPSNASRRKKGDSATDMLPLIDDVLLASGTESLVVNENEVFYGPERTLQLVQTIRGIPVINGVVSMSYNADTGAVSSITAHFVPDRGLPHKAELSLQKAQEIVAKGLASEKASEVNFTEEAYLAYFADFADPDPPHLVWAMRATTEDSDDMLYVDTSSGLVVGRLSMRMGLARKEYDMNNSVLANFPSGLPAELTTPQIDSQLYRSTPYYAMPDIDSYLRLKIPDSIPQFPSTVHIVVRYGLNGTSFYTRANNKDYVAFLGAVSGQHTHDSRIYDTIVHEFAHSIGTRVFPYAGSSIEAFALHESYGDVATAVVDIARYGTPTTDTWIMAEGYYDTGLGMRSLRNPELDPLVYYSTRDWYPNISYAPKTEHYSAGVINHAYYLMVNGGHHAQWGDPDIPDTVLTALGEPTARNIFFNAFRNASMDSDPNFSKLKGAAMAYANAAYGSPTKNNVKAAFETVGICKTATVAPPAPTLQTIGDLMCAGRFNPIWDLIASATRYYAEVAPQNLGWAFSTPVSDVDGSTNHCLFQVNQPSMYRLRACNDCGCGPWSETYSLPYWSPCP